MFMDFSTKAIAVDKHRSPLAVVGVFETRKLTLAAEAIDRAANGALKAVTSRGDMEGRAGTQRLL